MAAEFDNPRGWDAVRGPVSPEQDRVSRIKAMLVQNNDSVGPPNRPTHSANVTRSGGSGGRGDGGGGAYRSVQLPGAASADDDSEVEDTRL